MGLFDAKDQKRGAMRPLFGLAKKRLIAFGNILAHYL